MIQQSKIIEPLISVIITCYNGEKFIGDAIESVINQTYQNWEIIVIDDGSTDDSKEIVDKYRTDQRIKYVQHDVNKGIAKTKNTGIRLARGDYLAFLDQDDVWLPSKLEMQVNCFKNQQEDVGMICTGMIFTDEKLKSQRIFMGFKDDNQKELVKSLYLQPTNSASIMMIKKNCFSQLGFFNEGLYGWDDFEMWMRIASQFKIKYIREAILKKRMHTENAQRLPKVQKEANKVFDQAVQLHPFLKNYVKIREAMEFYGDGLELLERGKKALARRQLKKSMERNPQYFRPIFLYVLSFLPGQIPIKIKSLISALINSMRLNFYKTRGEL